MSTKKSKKHAPDRELWAMKLSVMRAGVIGTLDKIEAGTVDETELMKLRNFCQFALALMKQRGQIAWEDAKESAQVDEVVSLMQDAKHG